MKYELNLGYCNLQDSNRVEIELTPSPNLSSCSRMQPYIFMQVSHFHGTAKTKIVLVIQWKVQQYQFFSLFQQLVYYIPKFMSVFLPLVFENNLIRSLRLSLIEGRSQKQPQKYKRTCRYFPIIYHFESYLQQTLSLKFLEHHLEDQFNYSQARILVAVYFNAPNFLLQLSNGQTSLFYIGNIIQTEVISIIRLFQPISPIHIFSVYLLKVELPLYFFTFVSPFSVPLQVDFSLTSQIRSSNWDLSEFFAF